MDDIRDTPEGRQAYVTHVRDVAHRWINLTGADKETYKQRHGSKLTATKFATLPSNNIPIFTLNNALNAINNPKESSGFGGQQLFIIALKGRSSL